MKQDRRMIWFLVLIEATLFVTFYYREIAWYPPADWDQSVYLTRSYALQESAMTNGLQELLRFFIASGHETGIAFPVEGALFGLFLGVPRLSRLCVGFVAFAVLQICVYSAARKLWGRAYGFAALGLVLCQSTLWFWAGGLFDYRIDALAYCLYGMWACLVLRSGLFDDRKWAVASALIGVLLVLNRFLTIVYLSGVLLGFGTVLAVIWIFFGGLNAPELNLSKRLWNLAISLMVLFCGTIPFMVLNAKAIYGYYMVGHLSGNEKYIRAQEFGVTNLAGHLLFYPKSVLFDHLGPMFIGAAMIAIFAGMFSFFTQGPRSVAVPRCGGLRCMQILRGIFLLGTIAGPLVVLTCDIAKSPVVGGIVGVPCALLTVWLMAVIASGAGEADLALGRGAVAMCAGVVLGVGAFNQLAHAGRHLPAHNDPESYERLAELDRWLVENARESGLSNPTISIDIVSDWFFGQAITASAFEQTGKLVPFRQLLGGTIAGVEQAEALSELANSDYVVLTTMQKRGIHPFYEKIRKYWNDLKSWSDENMLLVRTIPFEDYTAALYARPIPRIFGVSGGWITSRGLDLEAERDTLERFPVIRLAGTTNFAWLSKVPKVLVTVPTGKGCLQVPATLMRDGNSYTISLDTSSVELPRSEHVRFHISFNIFFVPKAIGLNEDTRELVLYAPSRREMRKRKS